MSAQAFIPKTGVEQARRRTYDKAFLRAQGREPALSWSNWIRRALDDAARKELRLKGCLLCQQLKS